MDELNFYRPGEPGTMTTVPMFGDVDFSAADILVELLASHDEMMAEHRPMILFTLKTMSLATSSSTKDVFETMVEHLVTQGCPHHFVDFGNQVLANLS